MTDDNSLFDDDLFDPTASNPAQKRRHLERFAERTNRPIHRVSFEDTDDETSTE